MTSNYSFDAMHIVLEGIASLEIGCILYTLCVVKKYFIIDDVNARFRSFGSLINVDKRNLPPALSFPEQGKKVMPSMKAMQCWALLHYLPLVVGDLVVEDDPHWSFLLDLCHLVDIIFAPAFTVGMTEYLKEAIADHLDHLYTMKQLYGDVCTLKPKHHFMVHFPSVILQSGPLVGMSCLRYELKNSFFKRCAHSMYCFRNVCKTLACRHEQFALYAKLTGSHARTALTVVSHTVVPLYSLAASSVVCSYFDISPTDNISVAKKVCRASIEYSQGQHVVTAVLGDGLPEFACIEGFVYDEVSDTWVLVVHPLHTVAFVEHYHSYLVESRLPHEFRVVRFEKLIDHHPVWSYSKHGETFITMRYVVIQ